MNIPEDVAARVAGVFGQHGLEWLDRLPQLMADIADQWQLAEVGVPFPGARASFVAPVVGPTGTDLVLKISPMPVWLRHEALALEHWAGRGAVQLQDVDVSRGALLMERARPGHSLVALALSDDRAATQVASGVIARLQDGDSSPPRDLPTIESWLDRLNPSPGRSVPDQLSEACREALAVADELLGTPNDWIALHGDLHHGNVLSVGQARWIATDPKGLIGPREIEAAALLRNPRRYVLAQSDPAALIRSRLSVLAEQVGYDPRRTVQWGFVLAVLAATWAFDDGEGQQEVSRWLSCATALREVGRAAA